MEKTRLWNIYHLSECWKRSTWLPGHSRPRGTGHLSHQGSPLEYLRFEKTVGMEYISDIWKELRRRHEHLYQMLVSRVNGERGYCCMVSFMSANLWSWLQNCRQEIPLRILNTIQTRRQIAGTKYDYETPGSNPESPKQLQLLSLLIPPELFVTVKDVNAKQVLVQGVQNKWQIEFSFAVALQYLLQYHS